jgi:hypothetical protein
VMMLRITSQAAVMPLVTRVARQSGRRARSRNSDEAITLRA